MPKKPRGGPDRICLAGYELKDSDAHDMRALRERFGVVLTTEQRKAIGSRDAATRGQ